MDKIIEPEQIRGTDVETLMDVVKNNTKLDDLREEDADDWL